MLLLMAARLCRKRNLIFIIHEIKTESCQTSTGKHLRYEYRLLPHQKNCTGAGLQERVWNIGFLRLSEYKKPDGSLRNNSEAVQINDTYKWQWHGWNDETTEYGNILHCNGIDYLKFSFGKAGNCAVSIREENGVTIVELVQDEIPDDEQGRLYWHLGCKTGWTLYLANLKSLLEGGIDLRNRNEDLKNVINS